MNRFPDCSDDSDEDDEYWGSDENDEYGGRNNSRRHPCEDICAVLPRLHNLRLRGRYICDRPFGIGHELPLFYPYKSTPAIAPFLNTLVVSCVAPRAFMSEMRGLASFFETPLSPRHSGGLALEGVKRFVDAQRDELEARDAKIYLNIASARFRLTDCNKWEGIVHADMVNKNMWAACPRISSNEGLVGIQYGPQTKITVLAIAKLAEHAGSMGCDIVGGGRLPVSLLHSKDLQQRYLTAGCVEKPLLLGPYNVSVILFLSNSPPSSTRLTPTEKRVTGGSAIPINPSNIFSIKGSS